MRVLESVRRRLGRPAGGHPASARPARRIAVVGNCQARAAAHAMRLLDPEAEVRFLSAFGIARRFPRLADLTAALSGFDAVFAGRFAAPFRDAGTFDSLKSGSGAIEIPVIVFPAFHPDLVYVQDLADGTGQRFVQSGVGDYHSALVLFAYLEGLSPEGARRLFDPEIYRRLGYLDLWAGAAEAVIETGRLAGHDLSADLLRWSRRGTFMHATNHPKMFVAADIARSLLRRAGIEPRDCDVDHYLPDEFIPQGTWPVYPEIAACYGVAGSELFLTQATRTHAPLRTMTLDSFIAASFAAYRCHARADFACPRVTAWRTNPAVWATLRARAGR